jgi:hypothetical protein
MINLNSHEAVNGVPHSIPLHVLLLTTYFGGTVKLDVSLQQRTEVMIMMRIWE